MSSRPWPSPFSELWTLDPDVCFLNHGSFGACPRIVLEEQSRLRSRMEREPVRFFMGDFEEMLEAARAEVAAFVKADQKGLCFVQNATHGINAVLRSLHLKPGESLLCTDQEYQASRNALDFAAARTGAEVIVVNLPFPLRSPEEITERIVAAARPGTRLCLVDHVTSQTGLVLPVAQIVRELASRGIDTLVDGAHGPGMVPLDLSGLGAAYYTGNCHKWLCAPKGAGILYVREDKRHGLHPLAISHGYSTPPAKRGQLHLEFDWVGTLDPSPWLCVPAAIRFLDLLLPGGMLALQDHNHRLALAGRAALCEALSIEPPCPEEMIGSMASVPLPPALDAARPPSALATEPLHDELLETYGIQVPIMLWPKPPSRLLRISAQIYNSPEQYEYLAGVLGKRFREKTP